MEIINYVLENRLILIPVLFIIGQFIKSSSLISNRFIPLILLSVGILFSICMGGDNLIDNIIQGVLVAGATVLGNEMIVQSGKFN